MKNQTAILLLATLILFSCKQQSNKRGDIIERAQNELTINFKKNIEFLVDDSSDYSFDQEQIYESGNNAFLIGFSQQRQTIEIYSFSDKKRIKKIALKLEGPNSTKGIDCILFLNFDSILLAKRFPSEVFLIDSSGSIKQDWKINEVLPEGSLMDVSGLNQRFSYSSKRNEIYFYLSHLSNSNHEEPYMCSYSLQKNAQTFLFGSYPAVLIEKLKEKQYFGMYGLYPMQLLNDSLFILNYRFDPLINIYNSNNGKLHASYKIASNYIKDDDFKAFPLSNGDVQENYHYLLTEPAYVNFIYDKYRNVYYKIVKLRQDLKDSEGKLNSYFNSKTSIICLDQDFNILGEKLLDNTQYRPDRIFATSFGLLIEKWETEKEGVITYSVLDISKK